MNKPYIIPETKVYFVKMDTLLTALSDTEIDNDQALAKEYDDDDLWDD